jgi:uncharacterized protein (TIGR03085 family)
MEARRDGGGVPAGEPAGEPVDARERGALCELLERLGPDAPTLCAGWTTSDLAAHLVLRERFRRWGDPARAREKAGGFLQLVGKLRSGPPLVPWGLPVARTYLNGLELFVHHEDVRRANGLAPRAPASDLERLCWQACRLLGLRLSRAIRPFGVELVAGDRRRRFGKGEGVVVAGPASELALYLSGRRDAADVEVSGPPAALEALGRVMLGL